MSTDCNDSAFDTGDETSLRFARGAALSLSAITAATFSLAMIAVPISGANPPGGGIPYPYLDTLAQYPRDYLWQYAAIFLMFNYLALFSAIGVIAKKGSRVFSQTSLVFASISAAILVVTYYAQVSVIPVSLLAGEKEGIPLITQYNPHGLFIAQEEIGYIFMILSFVALIPVFRGKTKTETAIRRIFLAAAILSVISFILITVRFGIDRKDRFEVIVISVSWLTLIATGILFARIFRTLSKK